MKDILKNDHIRRTLSSLRYHGFLEMEHTAYDRWNYDGSVEPKEDGSFDSSGLAWSDVLVSQRLSLLNYKDVLHLRKLFFRHIKWRRTFNHKAGRIELVSEALKHIVDVIRTREFFKCYAVASFYLAEQDFEEDMVGGSSLVQVLEKNGYCRLFDDDSVFVCREDPTLIYINEENHPFDLLGGWSNEKIEEILNSVFAKLIELAGDNK